MAGIFLFCQPASWAINETQSIKKDSSTDSSKDAREGTENFYYYSFPGKTYTHGLEFPLKGGEEKPGPGQHQPKAGPDESGGQNRVGRTVSRAANIYVCSVRVKAADCDNEALNPQPFYLRRSDHKVLVFSFRTFCR